MSAPFFGVRGGLIIFWIYNPLPKNWDEKRKAILGRDGHRCTNCWAQNNLQVDHIIPRWQGGCHEPSNLTTLCTNCHAEKHPDLRFLINERQIRRFAKELVRRIKLIITWNPDYERVAKWLRLSSLTDEQKLSIQSICKSRDTVVVLPTGSGKSFCIWGAGLAKNGLVIVFAPTIALMSDQEQRLKELGLGELVVAINSSMPPNEKKKRLNFVRDGLAKFLYIAPERLGVEGFLHHIEGIKVAFIAVDETHCLTDWQLNFRPAYKRIAPLRTSIKSPIMALTATAAPDTQKEIVTQLHLNDPVMITERVNRPNIFYSVLSFKDPTEKEIHLEKLLRVILNTAVVFVSTVKTCKELTEKLKKSGFNVDSYHGQLIPPQRSSVQARFMKGEIPVLVATPAFGMGVNKKDIRTVINYQIPQSLSDYHQHTGRAGRDKKPAYTCLFYYSKDVETQKFLIEKQYVEQVDVDHFCKNHAEKPCDSIVQVSRYSPNEIICKHLSTAGYLKNSFERGRTDNLISFKILKEFTQRIVGAVVLNEEIQNDKKRKLKELKRMDEYANSTGCRRHFLLSYFGCELKENFWKRLWFYIKRYIFFQRIPESPCCDVCHPQFVVGNT